MYKANKRHLQPLLISNIQCLPEKYQQRLENSWAGVFYREIFCRIKEEVFAVLYADIPSRPNVPVNVLLGLDMIKAGFGWSDEELFDHFMFDLMVRYALGYRDLKEGDFDLRTLYNFRRRLCEYNVEHGVNLLEQAFEDITDQQMQVFDVDGSELRMDSTQLASNITDMSRLQLLVESFQRVHRCLSEADQQQYAELFASFLKGSSGQYVYRIKGKEATHQRIQEVGAVMYRVLNELGERYAQEPAFQIFRQFFNDNFHIKSEQVQAKANDEISAGCLQSCDDLEATYRRKGNKSYKGYVTNVTQTCTPNNPLDLITKVQTAPNNTQDSAMLVAAAPNLKARMKAKKVYVDGGYASPEVDAIFQEQQVDMVATAITGHQPDPNKLTLKDYIFQQDKEGLPIKITCPAGQTVVVRWRGKTQHNLIADFDPTICKACPFHENQQCRAKPGKRDPRYHLDFTPQEARVAQRRQVTKEYEQNGRNPRAAVEAVMRVIKHPFPAGKLPVRGLFRVSCMIIGSAFMANARSITRYLAAKKKEERRQIQNQTETKDLQQSTNPSSPMAFWTRMTSWYWSVAPRRLNFSF